MDKTVIFFGAAIFAFFLDIGKKWNMIKNFYPEYLSEIVSVIFFGHWNRDCPLSAIFSSSVKC